ncbi:MAG: hypothetical protein WC877_00160 [Dehalococcoidales bacterium]|jgi:hypothetical protein
MTIGDVISGMSTVLSTQSLSVQPISGTSQWTIHNIYIPQFSTCEIYRSTSADDILILTTSQSLLSYTFHCTNTYYIKIKNIGTGSVVIGYDGVTAKE